jgi:hypothetical protein
MYVKYKLKHTLLLHVLTLPQEAFIIGSLLVTIAIGGGFWYKNRVHVPLPLFVSYKTSNEKDSIYVRFEMEAFDSIQTNFWKKSTEADVAELFHLALVKTASTTPEKTSLKTSDRDGTALMLATFFSSLPEEKRKETALNVLVVILYNLPPVGRNSVLSNKAETALRDTVSNIDHSKDLYKDLGTEKGTTTEVVEKAYKEKKAILIKQDTPEAKKELIQVQYAHQVLTHVDSKSFYDQSQIEPTVFTKVVGEKTLYVNMTKIAPTTLREFGLAILQATTTPGLDSMILDLRGNVGGALEFAQYFLGLFLGQNQFAFDLFHQDVYTVNRTVLPKFPELARYKEVAVLTDTMTQSTSELLTASFKRFKIGKVIGTKTRGWGTVENTYPLKTVLTAGETYSLLLVNSITLRDDGDPIEGRGVDPDVDIRTNGWDNSLSTQFHLPSIISSIKNVVKMAPMR